MMQVQRGGGTCFSSVMAQLGCCWTICELFVPVWIVQYEQSVQDWDIHSPSLFEKRKGRDCDHLKRHDHGYPNLRPAVDLRDGGRGLDLRVH